jgi:hypothetical protein
MTVMFLLEVGDGYGLSGLCKWVMVLSTNVNLYHIGCGFKNFNSCAVHSHFHWLMGFKMFLL